MSCDRFLVIGNDQLQVGVDPSRGGGVCWLSGPGPNAENLLNEYDCGRFIQQSYYGYQDGSQWNGNAWCWNPVQCGSWQNAPAEVLKCQIEQPGHIVTEVHPRNWGGQQLLQDVWMRSDITTAGDHVHIKLTMRYSGSQTNPVKIQELPAVFLSRRLSKLMFYDGPEPWKGKALQAKTPGPTNENYRITENWAAFVDPKTGQAVGVYSPVAQTMTCYRVGADGSTACSDCSYFAPTMRFSIKPGMELEYHIFITIGSSVEAVRKVFSGIRSWCQNNKPEFLSSPALSDATPAI